MYSMRPLFRRLTICSVWYFSLTFILEKGHGVSTTWLGTRNVSDLPCLRRAVLRRFLYQRAEAVLRYGTEKGKRSIPRWFIQPSKCGLPSSVFDLQPFSVFLRLLQNKHFSLIIELSAEKEWAILQTLKCYNTIFIAWSPFDCQYDRIRYKGCFIGYSVGLFNRSSAFSPNIF